ncbi:IS5 family transposase [Streptomyces anulatus]
MVDHGVVMRRHELTDREWELLAPLIPRAVRGRPRAEDRRIINGMVYKIRKGISWRDLPERYGSWQTVYTRFRRYAIDGVFTRALRQIQTRADAAGYIDWLVQIDSTIVRAHQHAAATGRKGGSTGTRVGSPVRIALLRISTRARLPRRHPGDLQHREGQDGQTSVGTRRRPGRSVRPHRPRSPA